MNDLEGCRAALSAALETPASPPPSLHPNLAEVYRERVADLQEALRRDPNGPAALEVVRGLIERVDLHPAQAGPGLEVEISGAIVRHAVPWDDRRGQADTAIARSGDGG